MDPDNAYRHMYYFSMEDKDNYGTGVYFNISDAAVRINSCARLIMLAHRL